MPHNSTITIFGGTGFLGQYIVRELAKQGKTIRIPSREPNKALPLKINGSVGQIAPFHCSIRNDSEVSAAIRGADGVINLIGIMNEDRKNSFQGIHVETAARISRIAKEEGAKKLLHVSALGADSDAKSAYARSKAAGELAVRTFFPDAIIFRPGIVFGPEDNFLNRFASLTRFSPIIPVPNSGLARLQPAYVGDIAKAAGSALSKTNADGETYELGGKNIYSLRALLELMLLEMNRKRFLMNLPLPLAKLATTLIGLAPSPTITKNQLRLMTANNIVGPTFGAKTFADLEVSPTALEAVIPTYLGFK